MLLCADNSLTKLQVVKYGSCDTDELRCLGMGRVYIRPIQVDITLGDIEDDDEHAEECLLCRSLSQCVECESIWIRAGFVFWLVFAGDVFAATPG